MSLQTNLSDISNILTRNQLTIPLIAYGSTISIGSFTAPTASFSGMLTGSTGSTFAGNITSTINLGLVNNNSSQAGAKFIYTGSGGWTASISNYTDTFAIYDESLSRSILNYNRSSTTTTISGTLSVPGINISGSGPLIIGTSSTIKMISSSSTTALAGDTTQFYLSDTTTRYGYIGFSSGGVTLFHDSGNTNPLRFFQGGSQVFTVTSGGNVDSKFGTLLLSVSGANPGDQYFDLSTLAEGTYIVTAHLDLGGASINTTYTAAWLYFHSTAGGSGTNRIVTLAASDAPQNGNGRIDISGTTINIFYSGARGPAYLYALKLAYAP